ncbi:hypothetical protein ACFYM2_33780 [Streptomyces sp. NPDC006711]|uniref:hypothetical protein n=1 Tax=Streptomyces sp. NPDC006711 TaxID=3364762 RepID=UPI0036BA6697
MAMKKVLPALSALRASVSRPLGVLLVFALSACSSQDRATSPQEVRSLAGSSQALQSRKIAEGRLRATVNEYATHTPLTLGLVTLNDVCAGGKAKELFFQSGDDQYKIRCALRITAYFGADPHRMGDVLDGILTAGDRYASQHDDSASIPFHHIDGRSAFVDYYRGTGPNPTGPNLPEPAGLFGRLQSLSWDSVRSTPKKLIEEASACLQHDPPTTRCLREPSSKTVSDIREQFGMVFKLEVPSITYYTVCKDGKTASAG